MIDDPAPATTRETFTPGSRAPQVLIPASDLSRRVRAMALDIRRDHPGDVHLVVVLDGAFVFAADLVRALPGRCSIDFISVSSYEAGTSSSGQPRIVRDLAGPLAGRAVVIVEDVVDTGRTLACLQALLRARSPQSLRTACLLDKPGRRAIEVPVDYAGFTIADAFVVGYGLDHGGRYRNLPYVAALPRPGA